MRPLIRRWERRSQVFTRRAVFGPYWPSTEVLTPTRVRKSCRTRTSRPAMPWLRFRSPSVSLAASAWAAETVGTRAPAMARAVASVRRRDKTILSSTACGVSCRARAEVSRYAHEWRFAPGPGFPGPPALVPPLPCDPPATRDSALCPVMRRATLAQGPAASVRGRDGSRRARPRQARRRDGGPGAAVRRRRPRRVRRQRRRPAAPRGRQAGPARLEVRARARADRARAGRRPAGHPRLHAARGAVAGPPRPRRPRGRLPDRGPRGAARARRRARRASA